MAEVHAEKRCTAASSQFCSAKDGAIATEHDHDLELGDLASLPSIATGASSGAKREKIVVLIGVEYRSEPGRLQLSTHRDSRLERVIAAGVRNDQHVPVCAWAHGSILPDSTCQAADGDACGQSVHRLRTVHAVGACVPGAAPRQDAHQTRMRRRRSSRRGCSPPSALSQTRYSRLPADPAIGDGMTPAVPRPRSQAAHSTRIPHPAGHRVPHDSLADAAPPDLELRFDQQNKVGAGSDRIAERFEHQTQGDERQVGDDEGRYPGLPRRFSHSRAKAQELAVALKPTPASARGC